ncbi:hypothetical protein A0H81_12418 [Grifola frondosa]|uniref:Uncharacterized protein n=1 Tax=Grifola frondosa TaxID=5627 RepID=A0A1C7LT43_GRIFR|nr:hypothetical protein A0H81_12418 [Grifola frondosa]
MLLLHGPINFAIHSKHEGQRSPWEDYTFGKFEYRFFNGTRSPNMEANALFRLTLNVICEKNE